MEKSAEEFSALNFGMRCECNSNSKHLVPVGKLTPKNLCQNKKLLGVDLDYEASEHEMNLWWNTLKNLISFDEYFNESGPDDDIAALLVEQLFRELIVKNVPAAKNLGSQMVLGLLVNANGTQTFNTIVPIVIKNHRAFIQRRGTALELMGYDFMLSDLSSEQESFLTDEILGPLLRNSLEDTRLGFHFSFPISAAKWKEIAMKFDDRAAALREMMRVAKDAENGIFPDVATEERYMRLKQKRFQGAKARAGIVEPKVNSYRSPFSEPYWVYYPKRWGKKSGFKNLGE